MENAKRRILTAACICLAFWLVVSLVIIGALYRPKEPAISVESIFYAALNNGDATIVYADGRYYDVDETVLFAQAFAVDTWAETDEVPTDKPYLAVSFAEQKYLLFYKNGVVEAYNGYAARGQEEHTYYAVADTVDAAAQITAYAKTNSTEIDESDAVRRDFIAAF